MEERLFRLRDCLFRSARAEEVSFHQGVAVYPIRVIRYEEKTEGGFGARVFRKIGFEVRPADLPLPPSKRDLLDAGGRLLRVTEVEETDAGTLLCWTEAA